MYDIRFLYAYLLIFSRQSSLKGRFDPELTLLIQLTLYKFSLWDTGATYGAKLQGLRYAWIGGKGNASPSKA